MINGLRKPKRKIGDTISIRIWLDPFHWNKTKDLLDAWWL